MSPTAQAEAGRWGAVRRVGTGGPTWLRAGVVVALVALAFVAAQTCQQSQIRVTQEQALAKATEQVDFDPRRTQIRMLRQGITSEPFWIVSLSVPGEQEGTFSRLATVRIDANTGEVVEVRIQRPPR